MNVQPSLQGGKILVDITDVIRYLIKNPNVSGIQRTVLSIAHQVKDNQRVEFIFWRRARFYTIQTEKDEYAIDAIMRFVKWRRALKLSRKAIIPPIFKISNFQYVVNHFSSKKLTNTTVSEDDIIFIIGTVWNNKLFLASLAELKRKHKSKLAFFIHDAIPIFGEEFVTHRAFGNFRDYLEWIDDWADTIYCNSNYSKADLVRTKLVAKASDAIVIPLAHEFCVEADKASDGSRRHLQSFLREHFDRHHTETFALCVGTIETRKNQTLLAKAWAELARERPMPLLILAGRLATNGDALQIILDRDHPPVAILENANDTMLEQLYKKCQFTLFPSHFEGWGLPVGESLWFGKPCLASNASSIPEVGGDYAIYFDPNSIEDIKEKIRGFLDGTITRPIPPRSSLRTWQQVAGDLIAHLQRSASLTHSLALGSHPDERSVSIL